MVTLGDIDPEFGPHDGPRRWPAAGGRMVSHIDHHAEYRDDMTQRRLEADVVDVTGQTTRSVLDSSGVVKLPTSDPMETVIYEAACEASIDGESGAGQFETHRPGQYLQHLIESGK